MIEFIGEIFAGTIFAMTSGLFGVLTMVTPTLTTGEKTFRVALWFILLTISVGLIAHAGFSIRGGHT